MKKDPDSTDEMLPEELDGSVRDTEPPPSSEPKFRGGEIIIVDDPDDYVDPDD